MDQVVQVAGALLILTAFAALQFGRMRADSRLYLVLNLIGSTVLTALAWYEEQWGFLLLEAVWAMVSAWGLIQLARSVPARSPHLTANRHNRHAARQRASRRAWRTSSRSL